MVLQLLSIRRAIFSWMALWSITTKESSNVDSNSIIRTQRKLAAVGIRLVLKHILDQKKYRKTTEFPQPSFFIEFPVAFSQLGVPEAIIDSLFLRHTFPRVSSEWACWQVSPVVKVATFWVVGPSVSDGNRSLDGCT